MSPESKKNVFLDSPVFAVVGASDNRNKFGNKVLRCYLRTGRKVIPVNPVAKEIEGISCVASVFDLPDNVVSISIVTPPKITEKVVREAAEKGIRNIWMQPGAESRDAIAFGESQGMNVIGDGSCILVSLKCFGH